MNRSDDELTRAQVALMLVWEGSNSAYAADYLGTLSKERHAELRSLVEFLQAPSPFGFGDCTDMLPPPRAHVYVRTKERT